MGFLSRVTTYDYDAPMVAMFRAAGAGKSSVRLPFAH